MIIPASWGSRKRVQTPSGNLGNLIRVHEFSDPATYTPSTSYAPTITTTAITKLANSSLVITTIMPMQSNGVGGGLFRSAPIMRLEYSTDGGTVWIEYDSISDQSGLPTPYATGGYTDRTLAMGSNRLTFIMENVANTSIMFRMNVKRDSNNNTCYILSGSKLFVEEYYDDVYNVGVDRDVAGVLGICSVQQYNYGGSYTITYYDGAQSFQSQQFRKNANTDVLVRFTLPTRTALFNDVTNSSNHTTVTYYYSEDESTWTSLGSTTLSCGTRLSHSGKHDVQFKITTLSKPYITFRMVVSRLSLNTTGANNTVLGVSGGGDFNIGATMIELRRENTPGVVPLRTKTHFEYNASVYTGISTSEVDVFVSSNMSITQGNSMLVEINVDGLKADQAQFNGVTLFRLYQSIDNGGSWTLTGYSGVNVGTVGSNANNTNRYTYNAQSYSNSIQSTQVKYKITAAANGAGTVDVNNGGSVGTKYATRMKFMEVFQP